MYAVCRSTVLSKDEYYTYILGRFLGRRKANKDSRKLNTFLCMTGLEDQGRRRGAREMKYFPSGRAACSQAYAASNSTRTSFSSLCLERECGALACLAPKSSLLSPLSPPVARLICCRDETVKQGVPSGQGPAAGPLLRDQGLDSQIHAADSIQLTVLYFGDGVIWSL